MAIGKEIKKIREEKKISQEAMAGEVFSRSYISQIERNLISPSYKAIQHIAKILNVSPLSLVDSSTICKLMTSDEALEMFLEARKLYLQEDYEKCIQVLPTVICAGNMLQRTDTISAKIWYVDAYYQTSNTEKALELSELFLEDENSYSRAECSIALKLIYIKGIIKYNKGKYHDSLECFLKIENLINQKHLDVDKTLLLDNLSMIQMIYESLGVDVKVEEYYNLVIDLSKKFNLISKGTLRSINRYYRDNSTDTLEKMVEYYESLMETAKLIGDSYRIHVLKSSIVELYLQHNHLDGIEKRLQDSEDSISDLKEPALKGYSYAFFHLFTGRYYVKLKEFNKALESYTKAQEYISNNKYYRSIKLEIDSLYNYAEIYYHKGEYESAMMYLHMSETVSKENLTTVRDKKINALKELIQAEIS